MTARQERRGAGAQETAAARSPDRAAGYLLRLFVSGASPRSARAIANIKAICERDADGLYLLEVVDIYQQPELARTAQLVAAPTLVKTQPPPTPPGGRPLRPRASARGARAGHEGEASCRSQAANQTIRPERRWRGCARAWPKRSRRSRRSGPAASTRSSCRPRRASRCSPCAPPITPTAASSRASTKARRRSPTMGTVFYANRYLSELLEAPLERLIGSSFGAWLARPGLFDALRRQLGSGAHQETQLRTSSGRLVPVYVALSRCRATRARASASSSTDLRAQKREQELVASEELSALDPRACRRRDRGL